MRVLVDKYVPFLSGVLEPYAEVQYLEPEEFTPERVSEADALIVRTRTKCNAALLEGSKVRFIATATIGFDHIDRAYCASHGIYWTNSPGCNAQAVCDYVEEALQEVFADRLSGRCLGVVGVGHVGSLVVKMAERRGMRVLVNDAPKQLGVSLDEIAKNCDVITFHTPLTKTGDYPTYHLCDATFLSLCRPDALIINAARGGIVDEIALKASNHPCVIDTWEGEPHINTDLLAYARLASYHIAGYSMQGKVNASRNCLQRLCEQLGLPALDIPVQTPHAEQHTTGPGDSEPGWLERVSRTLKNRPQDFEYLRGSYPLR